MPALAPDPLAVPRPLLDRCGVLARLLFAGVMALGVAAGGASAAESPRVKLATSMGDIVLELDAAAAPRTVANFLDYVDAGYYDSTVFHRVIEGFMIQGGGFDEELMKKSTRPPIRNEADNGLTNRRYSVAMARTSDPHSATAQFFINEVDNRNLDHTAPTPRGWGYTVFGHVIDGFDTVDAIAEVPTGARGPFGRDVPRDTVSIVSATRVDIGTSNPDSGDAPNADPTAVPPQPADLEDAQAGAIN